MVNASINYGNRNASTPLSNAQILFGFSSAVLSATCAVTMLRGRIARMIGKKGILTNFAVNATATGIAAFVNTNCIRFGEGLNGVNVYSDSDLKTQVGTSKIAAWTSIEYTALSRVIMGVACMTSPAILCALLKPLTVGKFRMLKIPVEMAAVLVSLWVFAPACVAVFPQKLSMAGNSLEEEFESFERVYFNKGI
jgi:hypothetical protein